MANRIYVASSWQHTRHHVAVEAARRAGLDVYDYRHPAFVPAEPFAWSSVTCELTVATAAKHLADKRAQARWTMITLAWLALVTWWPITVALWTWIGVKAVMARQPPPPATGAT